MTVTFSDAQLPSKLPTDNEPLDFTLDTDPVECVVSVEFPGVSWETVWQTTQDSPSGKFGPLYAGSSRVGSAFSVVRTGGWPGGVPFNLHVKEKETVTPKVAALHVPPVTPTALYSLSGSSVLVDRSGNGKTLSLNSGSVALNVPCLLPSPATGQWGTGLILSNGFSQLLGPAASFVYGTTAMTIFGVVAVSDLSNAGIRTIAGCGWWAAGHIDWIFQAVSDGIGGCKLQYTAPGSSTFTGTHDLPNSQWETVMLRRSASGNTVRLTVGPIANTDTSNVQPNSFSAVGTETFGIGWIPDGGTQGWLGAFVDFGFYPSEWADSDYTAQRALVLAL